MASNEEVELNNLKRDALILIGKRIQNYREKKNFSQVDLAGKVIGRMDTTNISRIESGRTNVTVFTLLRITKALEITLEDIVKDIS